MNWKTWRTVTILALLIAAGVLGAAGAQDRLTEKTPEPPAYRVRTVDPSAYPAIDDKELGQLRWSLAIADQAVDDFSNLEGKSQAGMESYRYALAFMTYFLALEQYHKLSACPELIRPRMDRLIEKIIQRPVWAYWAEVSQGVRQLEPLMNKPYPEQHDPVGSENIMYSGHLAHMIGLYETLYRDFKWSHAGSIVFEWDETERYVYDAGSLIQVIHDQFADNPWHMIACEPNACFPECNQHPALALILYDHAHGARLAEANQAFLEAFLEHKLIHPRTHRTAAFYLIKQHTTLSQEDPRYKNLMDLMVTPLARLRLVELASAAADGWTGAFMHAWQPDYIERHYPAQRDRHLRAAGLKQGIDVVLNPGLYHGFFAIYAAEVGDLQTRDQILEQADRLYGPVRDHGFYRYPYDPAKKSNHLTDKLIAVARANLEGGLLALHQRPFDDRHFAGPRLAPVDLLAVPLRRAIYDPDQDALIVSLAPTDDSGPVRLKIQNLDPAKTYRLIVNGKEAGKITGQERAELPLELGPGHDLVLMAE